MAPGLAECSYFRKDRQRPKRPSGVHATKGCIALDSRRQNFAQMGGRGLPMCGEFLPTIGTVLRQSSDESIGISFRGADFLAWHATCPNDRRRNQPRSLSTRWEGERAERRDGLLGGHRHRGGKGRESV